jgi:hypothetical protein
MLSWLPSGTFPETSLLGPYRHARICSYVFAGFLEVSLWRPRSVSNSKGVNVVRRLPKECELVNIGQFISVLKSIWYCSYRTWTMLIIERSYNCIKKEQLRFKIFEHCTCSSVIDTVLLMCRVLITMFRREHNLKCSFFFFFLWIFWKRKMGVLTWYARVMGRLIYETSGSSGILNSNIHSIQISPFRKVLSAFLQVNARIHVLIYPNY